MYNDIEKALFSLIYPIKYLDKPFFLYKSFLDSTILLMPNLSMLTGLLFL